MANEIGQTEVTAASQALVANVVQTVLKQKSILMGTVDDYSKFAVKGSKSVSVPKRTQYAAADKSENTDLTSQVLTYSVDTIALDKHKAIYSKLERIAGAQANVDVASDILLESAAELALQIDKDIITQLKLISTSAPDHWLDYVDTAGNALAIADIVNARKLLNKQNVPLDNRFMVISPDKEADMLNITNFIQAQNYGSNQPLINGEIGRVMGFTVLVHNSLSALDSLFYHKSHCGFAMQIQPEFATMFQLASVSDEFLLHQLYGTKVMSAGIRGVYLDGAGV
jgi:N4-gp56 family major capsid protein